MPLKPVIIGATLAITAETIIKKEQTLHPVEEYIHQDSKTGTVNVYQIIGSTVLNKKTYSNYDEAMLAIRDIK